MAPAPSPIVVGTDCSPASRRALVASAWLADRLRCPLLVVSAVEPLLAEAARTRRQLDRFLDQVTHEARDFVTALPRLPREWTVEAIEGEPASVLIAAADRAGARMIAVGSHGRGAAARLFLGSTTMRLLRATTRPILVTDWSDPPAPGVGDGTISRIVCGVDFSEGSAAAAGAAARLAGDLNVGLTLVNAVSQASVPVGWDALSERLERDRLAEAESKLAAMAGSWPSRPAIRARAGSPARALADETAASAGALIVVGLRGNSVHRPGSTALGVLAATQAPVLAVPD
jgi:nucleotide-binding universal stress UspA family protein